MGIKSQLYLRTGNKLSILTLTLSAPLCIWTLQNIAHQKKRKEEAKNIGILPITLLVIQLDIFVM